MHLSQVKLVVSDMDGTLLNSKHEISALFLKLFKKMKAHGIIFVAASGRPYYSIIDKFQDIKDNIIIVAENGGLAVKNEKTLLSNPIQQQHLSKITTITNTIPNTHPVFCTRDKAYVISTSASLKKLLSEYYSNYEVTPSVEAITAPIYKVALYHEESSETHVYPHVKHLEQDFLVKLSATHWVDISEPIANKGEAVRLIQNQYHITPEETLAFGDYNNDLEMLQNAYFSYAMENAHPTVKAAARFSTKSNNAFGVESILERLIAAKEKNKTIL